VNEKAVRLNEKSTFYNMHCWPYGSGHVPVRLCANE